MDKALTALLRELGKASIGACSCGTGTPDPVTHKFACRYRAIDMARVALAAAPQPPSASGERDVLNRLAALDTRNHFYTQVEVQLIKDARAALAPSPGIDAAEQKPVAWMADDGRVANAESRAGMHAITQASYCIPLFAAPPAAQPSAEWMAEAEKLVDEYTSSVLARVGRAGLEHRKYAEATRAALLAHLKKSHAAT